MRTTLTLDRDVVQFLRREVRRSGRSMKSVVNEALRVGFGIEERNVQPPPFRVEPHDFGIRPGIDLDRMNQFVDELEAEAVAVKLRSSSQG